jgi:hypothetical protein
MLARPLPDEPQRPTEPSREPPAGESAKKIPSSAGVETVPQPRDAPHAPSLLVDALAGARYTGPTRAMLVGPELRATWVFDRWSGGLLARYDASAAVLQHVPEQFSLSSATLGLAGGYRLLDAPVELVTSLEPTLAVVFMGCQRPRLPEPDVDAHVDMRLGARLGAAVPMYRRLRALFALGGEGVPAALFSSRHSRRHVLPELPGYLVGLSAGIELEAIR